MERGGVVGGVLRFMIYDFRFTILFCGFEFSK